jgi:hypothetical protein
LAAFAGIFTLLFVALPAYLVLVAYCFVTWLFDKRRNPPNPNHKLTSLPFGWFVRNQSARLRLQLVTTPLNQRRVTWWLQNYLAEFAFLIEFLPNFGEPFPYIDALATAFGPQVSFGDGIAFTKHADVIRLIQNPHIRKGKESLGWIASDSQYTFSKLLPTYLGNCGEDGKKLQISRDMMHIWITYLPNNIWEINKYVNLQKPGQPKPKPSSIDEANFFNKYDKVFQKLDRILPPQNNELPSKALVTQAIGQLFFFLATDGQMTQEGKFALLNSVYNGTPFLPHWFNFLLFGNLFENLGLDGYYTIRDELARYADSPAMLKVFEYADQETISRSEAIRNVASGIWFAGAIAPSNLAFELLTRLYSDPIRMVELYEKNPENFIKETTRLSTSGAVPLVNFLANQDQVVSIDGKNVTILANTPLHASIVSANRDPLVFDRPDEFDPDRPNIDSILSWNAVESLVPAWKTDDGYKVKDAFSFDGDKKCPVRDSSKSEEVKKSSSDNSKGESKTCPARFVCPDSNCPAPHKSTNYKPGYVPPRFCPGHSLSIELLKFIAERFKPDVKKIHKRKEIQIPNDKFITIRNKLDLYTTEVLIAASGDQALWNMNPPRAVDMLPGVDADLKIRRLNFNYELPTFDEDSPLENTAYKLSGYALNWPHIGFVDLDDPWDSKEDALEWRARVFDLPKPNVDFNKDGVGLTSDASMTRLAFYGLACQYTRPVRPTDPFHGDCIDTAVYVNDASLLYEYNVRAPYERYGAYAYFNKKYEIVGIYWCHGQELLQPHDSSTAERWEHAKWVWKTSFFAIVTIYDHLLVTHMIEANTLVTQTRLHLPAVHPLRQFLKPFTYHTISVNYSAATNLINEGGLVHRIWAFNYDEFLRVVNSLTSHYNFQLFPDTIDAMTKLVEDHTIANEDFPIVQDSSAYWNVVKKYVSRFLDALYGKYSDSDPDDANSDRKKPVDHMLRGREGYKGLPKDDTPLTNFMNGISSQLGIGLITTRSRLIDVLTQLIFNGTGRHEHVGQVSDYMMDPTFVGFKLLPDQSMQSIQSYTQQCALVVLTGLQMPRLIDDWSHLITRELLRNPYFQFKDDLVRLQFDIEERNIERVNKKGWAFESFNPKNIETSVSV